MLRAHIIMWPRTTHEARAHGKNGWYKMLTNTVEKSSDPEDIGHLVVTDKGSAGLLRQVSE